MKRTLGLTTLAVLLACGVANAQQINVKVGVLTDMSSLYADATGPGSVLAAKMAAADFMFIYRIIHSPFGEVLKAIRENEARAISLGYKTDRYKLVAFVLSATLAGVAGATKAIVLQLASLTDVNWPMSGEVVLMTLVGGLGTIFGPVVGAFAILVMIHVQNGTVRVG